MLSGELRVAIGVVQAETFALRLREMMQVDMCHCCSMIAVPVLYLQAKQDRLVDRLEAEMISHRCTKFVMHQIDAPHMLLQREPVNSISAIRDFLKRYKISESAP